MARLSGTILSDDESFKAQLGTMLRTFVRTVIVGDDARGQPDVAVVDGRGDCARPPWRSSSGCGPPMPRPASSSWPPSSNPDAILRSMRAGANEFFTWPPAKDALDEGITRTAGRAATSAPPQATTMVFFGAKGGAGNHDHGGELRGRISRLSKRPTVIVDLKPGLGEVSLFLGVRSRYTLLDASTICTVSTATSSASWW
jgi:hypothetical protein